MLKRHIKTAYNMSPEQYRDRWGLPHDYPMVAPNYTKQRSKLAKDIGFGTSGRKTQTGKRVNPFPYSFYFYKIRFYSVMVSSTKRACSSA